MTNRNRLIGIGIIFSICAIAISLMCITFSYAENPDDTDQNLSSNAATTIHLDTSQSTTSSFSITFMRAAAIGEFTVWDSDNKILTVNDGWQVSLASDPLKPGNIKVNFKNPSSPMPECSGNLVAGFRHPVEFSGWTGFVSGEDITGKTKTVYGKFTEEPVVDPTSACIRGNVSLRDNSVASEAEVKFGNKYTGEVYGSAISNSDGSFSINDINIDIAKKIASGEIKAYAYSSYPGYNISTSSPDKWSKSVEGDVLVFSEASIILASALVNVAGDEHHQEFIINITRSTIDDPSNLSETSMFALPYFGMAQNEFPPSGDVDFTISEDGSISASYIVSRMQIEISSNNICDEGYVFDYIEFNGEKHYAGEIVTITPSALEEPINAQVHYKPISQIAQTGDAIPYVIVFVLGAIAVVCYVISRKQLTHQI